MQTTILRNGIEMPLEGFGVFRCRMPSCENEAVPKALGGRLSAYRIRLRSIGMSGSREPLSAERNPRKELSNTTKVWIQEAGYAETKKAFEAS